MVNIHYTEAVGNLVLAIANGDTRCAASRCAKDCVYTKVCHSYTYKVNRHNEGGLTEYAIATHIKGTGTMREV